MQEAPIVLSSEAYRRTVLRYASLLRTYGGRRGFPSLDECAIMRPVQAELSIVIVNWNTCDLLRECLSSIYSAPCGIPIEVFVVDNASSDGSAEMVDAEFPQVRLIRNTENVGYSRANNAAIELAQAPNVLLLNSDAMVEPSALAQTVALLRCDDSIGALGCRLVGDDGEPQLSYRCRYPSGPDVGNSGSALPGGLVECASVWGAYQLVKRETIEQVGTLDEDFFMFYEDVDWCWRMHDSGWKIAYDPSHSVRHVSRASCDRVPSAIHCERVVEGEALLHRKHHTTEEHCRWLRRRLFHYGWRCFWYRVGSFLVPTERLAGKLTRSRAYYGKLKRLAAASRSPSLASNGQRVRQ